MTNDANAKVQIIVKRKFSISAEKVFDAFLNPKIAGEFLFKTDDGIMEKVEIDARVGGKFNIVENRNGQSAEHQGTYLIIDRPKCLKFSFGDNWAFGKTFVTIEIIETPDGCELTLLHEGVLVEYENQTHKGWSGILDRLSSLVL